MKSHCVEKLPHKCSAKHTSRDGLQVFLNEDGTYTGYCFSCGTYVPSPYEDKEPGYVPEVKVKTDEEIQQEIAAIGDYRTIGIDLRRLTDWALARFCVRVAVSEVDGTTPTVAYFPRKRAGQLLGYKAKLLNPPASFKGVKYWSVGDTKGSDLFGWEEAIASGSNKLFITEGELDAVALYQALKKNAKGGPWEHLEPAVVSLPDGSGSAKKVLSAKSEEIRAHFKDVILVFDMDDPGEQAAKDALQIFPLAKRASLPEKDANDCVIAGKNRALVNAVLFNAAVPKNTSLVWGSSLYQAGREQAKYGYSWPWDGMTELTRGIRTGETYYIGAGVKMGKSEVVNELAKHFIIEHNMKVFLVKPEEANRKTYQMVLGKVAGRIFHDPKVQFDYEAYDAASKLVGDKLCMLNLYQHLGWESLKKNIISAAHEGCKVIFIDPITNLVNGINAGETNTVLQEIAQELAYMAKDLDIIIFIFCHLKAPTAGDPHEKGGRVESYQFSGSRAMMRSCNYMIGLEGNKDPDLELEQRNIRTLVLLEDREFGNVGKVKLYWDYQTGLFNEIREA